MKKPATTLLLKPRKPSKNIRILTLRTPSGLSGDMLISGLSQLARIDNAALNEIVNTLGVAELTGSLCVATHSVNDISGWQAQVSLPHEHAHRRLDAILAIIESSRLQPGAKKIAANTFQILAEAEAKVHGIAVADVAFHEVGALDSILDICVAAALLDKLAPAEIFCSPLPLCDGVIRCEHGLIASPAPAVQEMLKGIPVYGIDSQGETVTPTALAFLLGAGARFGNWPRMVVKSVVRAYGGRILPGIPNGAIFALGTESAAKNRDDQLNSR